MIAHALARLVLLQTPVGAEEFGCGGRGWPAAAAAVAGSAAAQRRTLP